MINPIWLALLLIGIITGVLSGHLEAVTAATFEACKTAIMTISLPLAGVMALWLGMMRLAEKSGLLQKLAALLRPLLVKLFSDVPPNHPAMGSIVMNIAANMLGLGNAATPLGLRAMQDLQTLNQRPGVATDAMCTFLAINTSSIQLIPATAIGILAAAGAIHPTSIIGTSLVASTCSCIFGITAAKLLQRMPIFALDFLPNSTAAANCDVAPVLASSSTSCTLRDCAPETPCASSTAASFTRSLLPPLPFSSSSHVTVAAVSTPTFEISVPPKSLSTFGKGALVFFVLLFLGAAWQLVQRRSLSLTPFLALFEALSLLAIPFLLGFFPLYAFLRGIPVYEEFVEGAKEGFQVVLRIFPYLVAILVAIGIFRAAGCIDFVSHLLAPLLDRIGLPSELLPLIFVRPLSGSAATGCFAEIVKSAGPNSFVSQLAGTILGGTETTLYVLAIYFGSVAIKRGRHALAAGLIADVAGVVTSLIICHFMWR
jgi:spore maturation protein SpmA